MFLRVILLIFVFHATCFMYGNMKLRDTEILMRKWHDVIIGRKMIFEVPGEEFIPPQLWKIMENGAYPLSITQNRLYRKSLFPPSLPEWPIKTPRGKYCFHIETASPENLHRIEVHNANVVTDLSQVVNTIEENIMSQLGWDDFTHSALFGIVCKIHRERIQALRKHKGRKAETALNVVNGVNVLNVPNMYSALTDKLICTPGPLNPDWLFHEQISHHSRKLSKIESLENLESVIREFQYFYDALIHNITNVSWVSSDEVVYLKGIRENNCDPITLCTVVERLNSHFLEATLLRFWASIWCSFDTFTVFQFLALTGGCILVFAITIMGCIIYRA